MVLGCVAAQPLSYARNAAPVAKASETAETKQASRCRAPPFSVPRCSAFNVRCSMFPNLNDLFKRVHRPQFTTRIEGTCNLRKMFRLPYERNITPRDYHKQKTRAVRETIAHPPRPLFRT